MVGVPGWYREANGTKKRDLGVLEGYRKATLGGGRMVTGKRGFECRKISSDRSVDIRN